jgi:hypothetical protein
MLKKDVSKKNISGLRQGFKQYLNEKYSELSPASRNTICSDSFFIIREDIGISPSDVFELEDGIEKCRNILEKYFIIHGRKNPRGDASSYCGSIKYLKEYVCEKPKDTNIKTSKPHQHRIQRTKQREDIPRPSVNEIEFYLHKWDLLEDYRMQEEALDKLFLNTYPDNIDIHNVLIKVTALNAFYSTNIYAVYKMAKHIIDLNIDNRLLVGDITLVNDLALVNMGNGSKKYFYSFASKYCSRHQPLDYPIYDSYVDKLVKYYRDIDGFILFEDNDIKNYEIYKKILIKFSEFYGLHEYTLKQIDKYLWQLGKEKFPNNYKKRR